MKRAETVRTQTELRGGVRQRKSVAAQRGLSDSFPWQDDKTVRNAAERGKRSDQELKNEKERKEIDDRRGERGLPNKPGWQGLPLIHFPFPTLLPFSVSLSHPLLELHKPLATRPLFLSGSKLHFSGLAGGIKGK